MSRRPNEARGRQSRLARGALYTLVLAGVAALGLVALACGGSSPEGVAQVGSTQTATTGATSTGASSSGDPTAYAACMRRNGVPNFPDPDAEGHFQLQGGPGLDPNSPQFKAAEEKCEHLLPAGGEDTLDPEQQAEALEEALQYAACMRSHGVPNYPDPKQSGDGGIDTSLDGTGINPDSPAYKAAEEACKDLAPGAGAGGSTSRRSAPGGTP